MAEMSADAQAIVDAVTDLTRVTIALSDQFKTKSDAMRRLAGLAIPPVRIAAILAVPSADVRSALAKDRKRSRQTTESINEILTSVEGEIQRG